ncbi:uncharacterized protein LOC118439604 [Vespa mandarinia]|uniref:uncharacterized protein LOC118439604 n=1 Tax=Vespa mandarinia TaxID=7446 RepID=UPI00160DCD7B|nr:uncharacterized protein LOC118439604 [Vespa mandarinia]XP_035717232.1 uncharacterized protein LOC118439604 [Vespa mandarinia]
MVEGIYAMEQIFIDEETGESLIQSFRDNVEIHDTVGSVNNVETGEPEVNFVRTATQRSRKIPFQIPKQVKDNMMPKKSGCKLDNMEMEPVPIGSSFGQVNPICLFLPAIIYSRWFLALLMIFEVILHVWAHHKNKSLKNAGVYFRSPFHAISSEFCALCQNETCMDRVGKLQQKRMHKFFRQCNYMKRIVT